MSRNLHCRFCMGHGPQHSYDNLDAPASFSSVLVGSLWSDIHLCETRLIPSFTTWCAECEKISFVCPDAFSEAYPEGTCVVHGPPTAEQARVKANAFEAQLVLWRTLNHLHLTANPVLFQ